MVWAAVQHLTLTKLITEYKWMMEKGKIFQEDNILPHSQGNISWFQRNNINPDPSEKIWRELKIRRYGEPSRFGRVVSHPEYCMRLVSTYRRHLGAPISNRE
ncbi:hypothetical protein XENORESO_020744 [Xenotaenia resolanae]|uniref:Uncharacterized protein n=1 Tax=Xenotaenia resolanae TaxID=208358 RepID=A0ABV0WIS3_9TELE